MSRATIMTHSSDEDGELGRRILAVATELAFPRYPGTAGDARVIAILEQRLRTLGLETVVEPFSYDIRPALWVLRGTLAIGAVMVAAAGWVMGRSALAGLLLLGMALLPGLVFLAWAPWLERLYRRPGPTTTANVVARRRAAAGRATLILMAHHDSKSQTLTLPLRAAFTMIAILSGLALAALGVVVVVSGAIPGPAWLVPTSGGAGALAALALSTMRSGNRSPGAVDNAGSVAVLLELARTMPVALPDDVELVFLSPVRGGSHGRRHALATCTPTTSSGRPAYSLNLDGAGAPATWCSREVRSRASVLRGHVGSGALGRGPARRPRSGVHAAAWPGDRRHPFVHRGIPCLTLASGSLGRATMSVHSSAADAAANLDSTALAAVFQLATHTVDELVSLPRTPG
jgi:hypothetical protein